MKRRELTLFISPFSLLFMRGGIKYLNIWLNLIDTITMTTPFHAGSYSSNIKHFLQHRLKFSTD
jgi:hypothetical protein